MKVIYGEEDVLSNKANESGERYHSSTPVPKNNAFFAKISDELRDQMPKL